MPQIHSVSGAADLLLGAGGLFSNCSLTKVYSLDHATEMNIIGVLIDLLSQNKRFMSSVHPKGLNFKNWWAADLFRADLLRRAAFLATVH